MIYSTKSNLIRNFFLYFDYRLAFFGVQYNYYSQIVALGVIMQDLSGRKLGNYELRERLGRGGMAEVYKAYQSGMDRFVAVKVMLGHLASDRKRFVRSPQCRKS